MFAGLVLGLALAQEIRPLQAVLVAAGSVSGTVLSPDLDQDCRTSSELILIRAVPVLGWPFYFYWLPYALAIPHRHWASHAPVIGTIFRLAYLIPVVLLFGYLLQRFTGIEMRLSWFWWLPLWAVGLAFSDALHWLRDSYV